MARDWGGACSRCGSATWFRATWINGCTVCARCLPLPPETEGEAAWIRNRRYKERVMQALGRGRVTAITLDASAKPGEEPAAKTLSQMSPAELRAAALATTGGVPSSRRRDQDGRWVDVATPEAGTSRRKYANEP